MSWGFLLDMIILVFLSLLESHKSRRPSFPSRFLRQFYTLFPLPTRRTRLNSVTNRMSIFIKVCSIDHIVKGSKFKIIGALKESELFPTNMVDATIPVRTSDSEVAFRVS